LKLQVILKDLAWFPKCKSSLYATYAIRRFTRYIKTFPGICPYFINAHMNTYKRGHASSEFMLLKQMYELVSKTTQHVNEVI
jgi:hypothetical protein